MSREYKVNLRRVLAAWVVLLLSAVSSSPQSPLVPSIEEMAKQSDLVIIGKVLRNRAKWVDKKILSTSEVKPIKCLKPKREDPGDNVQVSFWGGTVGVINQHFTHGKTLQEGEIAVLFLVKPSRDVASYFEGLRLIHEGGKITLLQPGESQSRIENNRHLQQFITDLVDRVERGGSP